MKIPSSCDEINQSLEKKSENLTLNEEVKKYKYNN